MSAFSRLQNQSPFRLCTGPELRAVQAAADENAFLSFADENPQLPFYLRMNEVWPEGAVILLPTSPDFTWALASEANFHAYEVTQVHRNHRGAPFYHLLSCGLIADVGELDSCFVEHADAIALHGAPHFAVVVTTPGPYLAQRVPDPGVVPPPTPLAPGAKRKEHPVTEEGHQMVPHGGGSTCNYCLTVVPPPVARGGEGPAGHIVEFSVVPFTAGDLLNENFLKTPLLQGIPMGWQLSMIQHDDIDRTRYDEELTYFIAGWMQGKTGNGEEGLISRDDALCNIFCKLARLDKFSRNKHEDSTVTTTRSDRTDFWSGVPIVSLEENDDNIIEAVNDIMRKKQWIPNFHLIPFTFGIAFSRDCLKIFALYPNNQVSNVFDVQFVDDLVKKRSCVVAVINIARTLLYFQEGMIIPSTLKYGVWHTRSFKKIRLDLECCEIELGTDELYNRMCEIYTMTKEAQVTHMEHLRLGGDFNDSKRRIRLQPVGIQRLPQTETEAITAIKHIFQCLFKLHNLGIVHCDIRWGNIIEAFGNWYLIDFEFACRLHESLLLAERSAQTIRAQFVLDRSQPWSPRHDVYQVGLLLKGMMFDLPATLAVLRDAILAKDFTYESVKEMVDTL